MTRADQLVDRLAELAAGAEPKSRVCGIGFEMQQAAGHFTDAFIGDWLTHMGLNRANPLGEVYDGGDHWSGPRGARRRKLCYDLMVQVLASMDAAGVEYEGRFS